LKKLDNIFYNFFLKFLIIHPINKKIRKNKLLNTVDREYRDIDTLDSSTAYFQEREALKAVFKEAGLRF